MANLVHGSGPFLFYAEVVLSSTFMVDFLRDDSHRLP